MSTYAQTPIAASGPLRWFERATDWLDQRGKPAWITVMVIGFIFFWPVGLAILAYMIWSKRMFKSCTKHRMSPTSMTRSSGNSAFDTYRDETLRRLQDEQASFENFLERLRHAKDKAEFDQFMEARSQERTKSTKEERPDEDLGPQQA
jgi:predicted CopG family antitoxin